MEETGPAAPERGNVRLSAVHGGDTNVADCLTHSLVGEGKHSSVAKFSRSRGLHDVRTYGSWYATNPPTMILRGRLSGRATIYLLVQRNVTWHVLCGR